MKYRQQILHKKVLIVGFFPPPLGGVSVHIKRIGALLSAEGKQIFVFDVVKESQYRSHLVYYWYLVAQLLKQRSDEVHYHALPFRRLPIEFAIICLVSWVLRSRVVIVEHSDRFYYKKNWLYRKVVNVLVRLFVHKQILMGPAVEKAYRDTGLYLKKNYRIESPFCPPVISEEQELWDSYPYELKRFATNKFPLMVVNASKFCLWNGGDLYGLDIALDTVKSLKGSFPNIGLIMAVSHIHDQNYYEQMLKSIMPLKEYVYLLLEHEGEIWPLIKRADLFVRPSR